MGWDEVADKFVLATTTATNTANGDLALSSAPLIIKSLTLGGGSNEFTITESSDHITIKNTISKT